jgi:IclR family pca regulon transcriptional regulator
MFGEMMTDKAGWFSESLARGLKVVCAFDRKSPKMRISDVATKTGMTRASARRYLLTLAKLGYVGVEGDWFYPMPRILELGYSFVSSAQLEDFLDPILKRLSETTDAAARFAVLDKYETLCLGTTFSQRMLGYFISVGARHPAYAASMGKVLLAGLPKDKFEDYLANVPRPAFTKLTLTKPTALRRAVSDVHKLGYAINRGELNVGIVGVAVPVRSRTGTIVAAVNVSWISVNPLKTAEINRCLGPLREAAKQIETRLSTGPLPLMWSSR